MPLLTNVVARSSRACLFKHAPFRNFSSTLHLRGEKFPCFKTELADANIIEHLNKAEKWHMEESNKLDHECENIQVDMKKVSQMRTKLADVGRTIDLWRTLKKNHEEWDSLQSFIRQSKQHEKEEGLCDLALEDCDRIFEESEAVEKDLIGQMLPPDKEDNYSAVLEVRAGVGGTEASLFAFEMLEMYRKYANKRQWTFNIVEKQMERDEKNGIKSAIVNITGNGVFGRLRFESGVHRVQRVPKTDSAGRIHTSTISIAILPKSKQISPVKIRKEDIRVDTFRSSGPGTQGIQSLLHQPQFICPTPNNAIGGQNVDTTNSAVRIVHLPTNVVVECQESRSQAQNREKAMLKLEMKLYQRQIDEASKERSASRLEQIGLSAGRSDKIRTYNFPQNRVTDHRIQFSSKRLQEIMNGDSMYDDLVDRIHLFYQSERLRMMSLSSSKESE